MHLCIFADELRPQDIVDDRDKAKTDGENEDTLPDIAEKQHDESRRKPDDGRADHRDDREQDHDEPPDGRRWDVCDPEGETAEKTLDHSHDYRSFEGGSADGDKFLHQELVMFVLERRELHERAERLLAVDQEVEQGKEHDEDPEDKVSDSLIRRLKQSQGILTQILDVSDDAFLIESCRIHEHADVRDILHGNKRVFYGRLERRFLRDEMIEIACLAHGQTQDEEERRHDDRDDQKTGEERAGTAMPMEYSLEPVIGTLEKSCQDSGCDDSCQEGLKDKENSHADSEKEEKEKRDIE